MEQLKRLARHPLKIMDDLLAAAAAVAAAPDLPWEEKAERLRATQEACLQEMEANYAAFRRAAAAEEVRLQDILGEGGRSALESARRCAERLRDLLQAIRAREDLLQDWEDGSPAEFLRTYRGAMESGDRDAVALLEACGDRILRHLGERAHLETFRQMRRQRQARDGTPEEQGAVRSLDLLADLRREAEVLYGLVGPGGGDSRLAARLVGAIKVLYGLAGLGGGGSTVGAKVVAAIKVLYELAGLGGSPPPADTAR